MPAKLKELAAKGLAHPPSHVPDSIQYEAYTGSSAYGASDNTSDIDVIGFSIPDKKLVFPHSAGYIDGFGHRPAGFEVYQQHEIVDSTAKAGEGCEYDYSIYSIVKYFNLCFQGNPSMIGSLFLPSRCVLHLTPIGQQVLDNRKLFLNKSCYPRFRGYAYQMLHKIRTKSPTDSSKRKALIEKFGYDTKYAMNLVRLLLECEMILTQYDLDVEINREVLKSIRRGDWKIEDVEAFFTKKESELGHIHANSTIPTKADEEKVKQLLLNCLEQHFGSLKDCVEIVDKHEKAIQEIKEVLTRCGA